MSRKMTEPLRVGGAEEMSLQRGSQQKSGLGADIHRLLARLDKVKCSGPGRWLSCCPAHDDRSPSLSIRETGDGTILVKCFAGCPTVDVLSAVGLEMYELFPNRDNDDFRTSKRPHERWISRDVLVAVAREMLVVMFAAEAVHDGQELSQADLERLAKAAGRLRGAAMEVGCHV